MIIDVEGASRSNFSMAAVKAPALDPKTSAKSPAQRAEVILKQGSLLRCQCCFYESQVETTIATVVEVMISESNANYPDRVAEIFVLGAADS